MTGSVTRPQKDGRWCVQARRRAIPSPSINLASRMSSVSCELEGSSVVMCHALDQWRYAVMTSRTRPDGYEVIVVPKWDGMQPPGVHLQEIATVEIGPPVGGPPLGQSMNQLSRRA